MREEIAGWFAGRLPDGWFSGAPEIDADRDEIWVVGRLDEPALDEGASGDARRAAAEARIKRFREDTRTERMRISQEAQRRFGAAETSWGAACGDVRQLFTTQAIPVMTRLRLPERGVLDTLIDAGVARSRSEALAWCVKLVGKHQSDWIASLRDAIRKVEDVRREGPAA